MNNDKKVITAHEFQLIDPNGNIRAVLTSSDSGADLVFSDTKGKSQLKLSTGEGGLSALNMYDIAGQEKISVSVDDKGTHVYLAGAGKQESYLFLKNSGASGLVLTDKEGNRRLEAKVGPDGKPDITIYPVNGEEKKL